MIISISAENMEEILKNDLNYQQLLKKSILKYIDEIASNSIDNFNFSSKETSYHYLVKMKSTLQKVEENIDKLNYLSRELKTILALANTIDVTKQTTLYQQTFLDYQKTISYHTLEIQKTLNKLLDYIRFKFSTPSTDDILNTDFVLKKSIALDQNDISEEKNVLLHNAESITPNISTPADNPPIETAKVSDDKQKALDDTSLKEHTLVISDLKQKVILPYGISELKSILEQHPEKYKTLQEIIDDKYTIPMSYYKNTTISRFKETYRLVRSKSNGSVKEALDLGLELFFKYDLNPAIITACKNIDELDVYIACLEDNDINDFKCFDIVYEMLPVLKSKKHF